MNSDDSGEERRKPDDVPLILINGREPGEREQLRLPLMANGEPLDYMAAAQIIVDRFGERGAPGSRERMLCEVLKGLYFEACAMTTLIGMQEPGAPGVIDPRTGEPCDLKFFAREMSDMALGALSVAESLYPPASIDPMKVN